MGEDDGVAVADEVVDADPALGGVQLQVGDGVADGEPRHGGLRRATVTANYNYRLVAASWCYTRALLAMVGEGTERSVCSRADAEVGDGLRGEVAPRRGAWAPRSRPRGSCLGLLRSVRLTCRRRHQNSEPVIPRGRDELQQHLVCSEVGRAAFRPREWAQLVSRPLRKRVFRPSCAKRHGHALDSKLLHFFCASAVCKAARATSQQNTITFVLFLSSFDVTDNETVGIWLTSKVARANSAVS